MSKTLRMLADKLLPQTYAEAAARCPKSCWKDTAGSGSQGYVRHCCQYEDCKIRCS
ncbi:MULTISPECIES: hypothetical protein [Streptomyces]|uniref:hypothetical protein n=1 Tax=Streptomyces TaxID=1883 RepID=UPI0002E89DE8|nr:MULTISPECIES: hypothetical protein [Streptomyces]MYS66574.1 hypothetical protein [Streptomyces sp. SID5473]